MSRSFCGLLLSSSFIFLIIAFLKAFSLRAYLFNNSVPHSQLSSLNLSFIPIHFFFFSFYFQVFRTAFFSRPCPAVSHQYMPESEYGIPKSIPVSTTTWSCCCWSTLTALQSNWALFIWGSQMRTPTKVSNAPCIFAFGQRQNCDYYGIGRVQISRWDEVPSVPLYSHPEQWGPESLGAFYTGFMYNWTSQAMVLLQHEGLVASHPPVKALKRWTI